MVDKKLITPIIETFELYYYRTEKRIRMKTKTKQKIKVHTLKPHYSMVRCRISGFP